MSSTLLLSLRLVLAAVLAVAGTAKLLDRDGARRAAEEFGVPWRFAGGVAVGLPLVELAVAVALVPAASAQIAALAAVALLVAFSAAIGVAVARGRAVECHCFGALSSSPAGPAALARNLALLAGAAVVAATSPAAWNAVVALGVAFAAVIWAGGVAMLRILRAHGRSLARVERLEAMLAEAGIAVPHDEPGLPVGTPAPALERLPSSGVPLLLLFTDPGCGPCRSLEPDIARWRGSGALALLEVTMRDDRALAAAYAATATPSAVLISPDGVVASPLATGPDAIRSLAGGVTGGRRGLPVGAAVDPLPVTSAVDGAPLDLAALGEDAVLVFWNPGCGYCRAMEPTLREWAESPPEGAPRVVLVSSGAATEGLEALTVLDPGFAAGRFFGATGTPTAVRLDAAGRVASGLATGADAALALARPFWLAVVAR